MHKFNRLKNCFHVIPYIFLYPLIFFFTNAAYIYTVHTYLDTGTIFIIVSADQSLFKKQ